jgi:hypothetical protein
VDDALFRADPAELRVVDEMAPGLAPVCDEGGEGAALETVGDVCDGGADNVVAAANSEGLQGVSYLVFMFILVLIFYAFPWVEDLQV